MTDAPLAPAAPRLGRPRDDSRDGVILTACLELVAEVGYERVSMDAVAARAHASKATIYRRWSNKADLVAAAVQCRAMSGFVAEDCGSLRSDLLQVVTCMARTMGESDIALLTGVFAGMRNDPQLAGVLRSQLLDEKAAMTAPLFARATERGEPLHPAASVLFHEIAPAVLMHRLVVVNLPTDEAFCTHLVDDVLLPVLTPFGATP